MRGPAPIPGFADLQVNGFAGVDFSSADLTEDAFAAAARRLRDEGTAVFLPTVITSPPDVYAHVLPLIARMIARDEFRAQCPGIHLEGPFICGRQGVVGAHNADWVRPPDVAFFRRLFRLAGGRVKILTLAPEIPGAARLARAATAAGVVVSAGHTLGTAADLDRIAAAGARTLTHLGNGLPAQLPKFGNPLWAGLADDRFTAMIIADGHHVPDGPLKAMIRVKGVARVIITTDASPVAGLPPGRYRSLGNDIVLEENGLLHNPAKGCMVGSSATMLRCMNHLASLGCLSPEELVAVGYRNPLRLIGVRPRPAPAGGPRVVFNPATERFRCERGSRPRNRSA